MLSRQCDQDSGKWQICTRDSIGFHSKPVRFVLATPTRPLRSRRSSSLTRCGQHASAEIQRHSRDAG